MATSSTMTTPMTLERFKEMIAAYGAAPARWPAAERAPAQAFLAASPDAQLALTAAHDLDVVLDTAPQMDVSSHFRDQMVKLGENAVAAQSSVYHGKTSSNPATTGSIWRKLATLIQSLWQPARKMAGIYAGAGALGLAVGIFAPVSVATTLSANSDGMTNEDIMTLAFASPTETAVSNSFEWTE